MNQRHIAALANFGYERTRGLPFKSVAAGGACQAARSIACPNADQSVLGDGGSGGSPAAGSLVPAASTFNWARAAGQPRSAATIKLLRPASTPWPRLAPTAYKTASTAAASAPPRALASAMRPAPSFGKQGERSPTSRRLPSRVIASTSCFRAPAARWPTASECAPAASHCSARATSEDGGVGEGVGSCVAIVTIMAHRRRVSRRQRRARGSPLHRSTCGLCLEGDLHPCVQASAVDVVEPRFRLAAAGRGMRVGGGSPTRADRRLVEEVVDAEPHTGPLAEVV